MVFDPIVLHGLVQADILDDHSETTYMNVDFEGTSYMFIDQIQPINVYTEK